MAPIDIITDAIRKALGGAIADSQTELEDAASKAGEGVGPAMQGIFSGGFSLDDILLLIPGVGEVLTLPGIAMGELVKKAGEWVLAIASGWTLGEFFSEALKPVWLELIHAINDAIQSEIFDPQTAAQLVARRLITPEFGRSEAAGGNLAGDHFDKLADMAQTRPGLAQLFDALNRRDVDRAAVFEAMQRNGVPDFWLEPLINQSRNLVSPADLALANLRGNIDQQTLRTYGNMLGYTDDDLQLLVDNTGEPPGPQELGEALRRGFIDQATFEHGIRQSRVRNEWIQTMLDLRFSPMSVADAVRAVVENYLTSEQGQKIAEQNGLMSEHWPIMVEAFGRPLAHEQMMQLYHRGQATLDEVHQAFRESDLKDKYIDKAVELGRRLIPERTIVSMLNHGVVDRARALQLLQIQGFTQDDALNLISLGTAERVSTHKTLSRSDIVSLYEDALIKRDDAITRLEKLGYSQIDAVDMLDLADYKAQARTLKALQLAVKASFLAHHLTTQEALNQLEHAGMTHDQAQQLIDEWSTVKGKVTRTLTEAQVLHAGKEGVIGPENTRERLKALGLADDDCTVLMKAYGVIQ